MQIPNLPNLEPRLFKYAAAISILSVVAGLWFWISGKPTELELPVELSVTQSEPEVANLIIHVVGDVVAPGVVELPAGSRVIDAVQAAGGATKPAKLASLNLARVLFDGEQIVVGGVIPGASSSASAVGKLNINQASSAQLEGLPGIGPVIAGKIISHRESNGPFRQITEIQNVSGIGPAVYGKIKDLITVL
jgi:competence protein ComEA